MEKDQFKDFTWSILRWHKKIIKPWKKREVISTSAMPYRGSYVDGWNACLKEIDKNHKKLITFLEEKTATPIKE